MRWSRDPGNPRTYEIPDVVPPSRSCPVDHHQLLGFPGFLGSSPAGGLRGSGVPSPLLALTLTWAAGGEARKRSQILGRFRNTRMSSPGGGSSTPSIVTKAGRVTCGGTAIR